MNTKVILTIITTILTILFAGCSTKKVQTPVNKKYTDINKTKKDNLKTKNKKVQIPKPNTDAYTIYQLANEISQNFHIPILTPYNNRKYTNHNMTLTKSYTNIKVVFNNKNIFNDNISTFLINIKDKLKKLSQILQKYPSLIIQVISYNSKKIDQNLLDERAINIAETLFNYGLRHEIYAKGCTTYYNIQKVAIYIYPHIKYMQDNCRN